MADKYPFRVHWRRLEGDVVVLVARTAGKLLIERVDGSEFPNASTTCWVTAESSDHWVMAEEGES